MDELSQSEPRRRVALPMVLFLATCASTFWTGATSWHPIAHWGQSYRSIIVDNWRLGLLYMGVVLGILLMHEMGHFLMTLLHRIPASLPYFIPLPIVPFGTLGAVIGMDGAHANRRKLFDMGVAGPLAGLAVTVPVLWIGIRTLKPVPPVPGELCFHNPLLIEYMIAWLRPDYPTPSLLFLNQFNAFLMAGWVGVLVTGLNMLPVSQFDGGHVAYALLGKRSYVLARGLIVAAIVGMVVWDSYFWILMFLLVVLLGPDHPPTADDRTRLGWPRVLIGWASLLIPILCFPLLGIEPAGR
ncbi:MAG: site-2 protease family protein [Planctomycetaceae bacterium]|nr:site-2 protease family protein [Planctomycetaceae bacterium]